MAQISSMTTTLLGDILRAGDGLPGAVAELAAQSALEIAPLAAEQVQVLNVTSEVAERAAGRKYPLVYLYCEKLRNLQRTKFVRFSGKANMAIEVRVTHDRLEGLEQIVQLYVDAVTEVLENKRGSWGQGVCYLGGYEVSFPAVKHGGRNFLQTAKVTFELEVTSN